MKKLIVLMFATAIAGAPVANAQDFMVPHNGAIIGDGTEYMEYCGDPVNPAGCGYKECCRSSYLAPTIGILAIAAVTIIAVTTSSSHRHGHGHGHSHN